MISSQHNKLRSAACVVTGLLLFASLGISARAQQGNPNNETTNITVIVKEDGSGQPIGQAHITLEFFESHGQSTWRKPKKISYNAKTDAEGRCKLLDVTKGHIILTVTEPSYQSYGKELQLQKDNQVFEVKLKKPQPLL